MPRQRTTREVLEGHLRLREAGEIEEDLSRHYAPDVVLLTENSVLIGHDGIRRSAARLREQLPGARYRYLARQVHDDFALLVWEADSERYRIRCGADSFVVRGGLIVMQTVHYRLLPASGHET